MAWSSDFNKIIKPVIQLVKFLWFFDNIVIDKIYDQFYYDAHDFNNNIKGFIQASMESKKKLSSKEIYRTLCFHYHIEHDLPLDLLADMVSLLYYPI